MSRDYCNYCGGVGCDAECDNAQEYFLLEEQNNKLAKLVMEWFKYEGKYYFPENEEMIQLAKKITGNK